MHRIDKETKHTNDDVEAASTDVSVKRTIHSSSSPSANWHVKLIRRLVPKLACGGMP